MQLTAISTIPAPKANVPIGTIMAEDYPDDVFMWDVKFGGRYEGTKLYSSVSDAFDGARAVTADPNAPAAIVVRTSAGIELRTGWMRYAGKDFYRPPGMQQPWKRLDLQRIGHYGKYFEDPKLARAAGVLGVVDGRSWARLDRD